MGCCFLSQGALQGRAGAMTQSKPLLGGQLEQVHSEASFFSAFHPMKLQPS